MDSDSSMDEDRNRWNKQDIVPMRPNMNDHENSDVSDEENISNLKAARSIESPPESPQGETHFESPPASPDPENKPGTPSPIQSPDDSASYESPLRSPDSQPDSHNQKPDSPPRSHGSFMPRSPSPTRFTNRSPPSDHRSRSPASNYPRSPSPMHSPNSNHSLRNKSPNSIQSPLKPRTPPSPNSIQSPASASQYGINSPSQRSQSPNFIRSPSPFHSHSSHHQSESPRQQSNRQDSESPSRSQGSLPQDRSPRRFEGQRSSSCSPQSNRSPIQQRRQHDSNNSDDGRSNISSASSFSSPRRSPPPCPRSPPQPTSLRVKTVAELKSHVEDLSDVSDLDSMNSMSDDEPEKSQHKENGDIKGGLDSKKELSTLRNTSTAGLEGDDTEQLDFEAEEKEEGECDVTATPVKAPVSTAETVVSEDEGELKGDELEEGEITDEGEVRPEETEPRPICRFYNRGQCTWGASCRFVHPGVTDKGNYTMFEMVRPLVPVNGPPPMYGPPIDPYRAVERPIMGPPVYQQPPARKEETPQVVESAWERGLRQAKEMLRKSSKRKETEVDFEEKKMNLSLGQDELDKENDYYTRTASPVLNDELDRWGSKADMEKRYRGVYEEYSAEGLYYPHRSTETVWHQRPHYDESMRSVYTSRSTKYYPSRSSREKEYYSSSKRAKYSQREVIVQRTEKTSWKDDSPPARPSRYAETRASGGRGDEWADPWMRSKTSPLSRKQRSRKQSYSSGSSYSSSSSSRSSRSSSSSYSRSRSRSRSSRSRSRDKPSKMSPPRRLIRTTSPLTRGPKVSLSPALLLSEKKATTERSILMNPPPPSPRSKAKALATNPSPPSDRPRPGMPARLLAHSKAASAVAAAMRSARSKSKSSRSSSNSDSSGSSSDSSESSFSSSSSIRQKRIVIDERLALAQAMKVKAMDALKLSGQKQQIKLTLKGTGAGDRPAASTSMAGKKRPAESPPLEFSPPKVGGKMTPKKTAPSRREELLKQLKAVEDAIARKRSKIN